jgi:hypothetical protein
VSRRSNKGFFVPKGVAEKKLYDYGIKQVTVVADKDSPLLSKRSAMIGGIYRSRPTLEEGFLLKIVDAGPHGRAVEVPHTLVYVSTASPSPDASQASRPQESSTSTGEDGERSFRAVLERGIEYEGLRESINLEIAHQNALVNEHGEDTELGRHHRESIVRLAAVLRRLTPSNDAAIEIADLLLELMKSERTQTAA